MQKFLLWVALLLCNIVILNATTSTGANTKHHNDYVRPVVIKNVHSGMKKLFNYRTNTGNANFGRYTAKSSGKAVNAIISNTYGSGNSWAFAKKDIKYNMMSIDSLGLTEITCHDNGTKHTTADDYIEFWLAPGGSGLGTNYNVSAVTGTVTPSSAAYGIPVKFRLQNGSAGGGNITIVVTDASNPGITASQVLQDPGACSECEGIEPIIICQGESYTLKVPTGYTSPQWYKDGIAIAGPAGTQDSLIVTGPGSFTFTGLASDGCILKECCPAVFTGCVFDLALKKQIASSQSYPIKPGDAVTFTITVYNQGNIAATSIQLVDYIPAGLTLADPDWAILGGNAYLNVPIPGLAPGASTTRDITFTVDPGFVGSVIVNRAEISNASNNFGVNDIDSSPDSNVGNDAGGNPESPSDDSVNGNGTGTPGDSIASTDEDDADPALILVSTKKCPDLLVESVVIDADCGANNGSAYVIVMGANAADYTYMWSTGATTADVSGLPAGIYTVTITDKSSPECKTVKIVNIGNNDGPVITAVATNAACGQNGSIIVTITSGVGPFTIAWSGAASGTFTLPGLGSHNISGPLGWYNIEVTSANGCKDFARVQIEAVNNGLAVSTTQTSPDCNTNNGSITINVTPGTPSYNYYLNGSLLVNTASNNYTVNNLAAGVYIIKVVDAHGCVGEKTVVLLPNTPPVVNPGIFTVTQPVCSGSLGSINFAGGLPGYIYELYLTGNNTPVHTFSGAVAQSVNVAAGVYYVKVIDPLGCEGIISDIKVIAPNPLDFTVQYHDPSCDNGGAGNNGKIDIVEITGGYPLGALNIQFINKSTNVVIASNVLSVSGLSAGTYIVRVSYNTSCTKDAEVTLEFTCPTPMFSNIPPNVTVECDQVPLASNPPTSNDCGPVQVALTETTTHGNCPDNYILTRTWVATNACGNKATAVQIITVQDTKAPVLVGCPANITVECNAVTTPAVVTATDNCDANVEVTYHEVKTPGQCLDAYTLTRTWTATDNCGNTSKCTQIITVQDTKAPVLAGCPANITVECDAVPTPAVVTATDNCDANVEVTYHEVKTPGQCLDAYTLTRTWTATDNCGNTSKCTQIITVQDTKAPVLAGCPANITVECDAVPTPAVVTATDNCDANVEVTYHEVKTPGQCLDAYTLTRTWTATDNCGNTSKCTQIITVQDTKAPVLVGCPANITVECDAVPTPAVVTATDNCDANVEVTYHEVKTPGQCLDAYTLTRTWTATDNCGNTSKCTQIITVQDTKAPVLAGCPANITVECDAVPTPAVVTATDNCDANVEVAYHEVKTPGQCLDSYTLTRTWTATDNCGNTSKCTQIITVQDTKAPVLVGCPANITVECDAVPTPAVVTATDNCDANVEVAYHEVKTPGQCLDSYTLTRTWTATDNCGNTSKCTQIITVQDTKAPVLAGCPANITVECDAVPTPAVVTATDNCDANVEVTYHEVKTPGQCLDAYTLTRTWTATDNCGNTSKCTQIITVQDTKAPVLAGCPANITVECDAVPTPAVVTATDNCDTNVEVTYHEVKTPGQCLDSYTLTRTWTATDNCGNTSKCTQIITVQDTKAPVLVGCPANITVECDAVPTPAVVTATDNCDANVEVTYHEVKTPGQCLDAYTLTRTWTATDNCGNTSKCTQIITVQDTKAPVLVGCPANITVECDAVPTPAVVTATDNCDANVEVAYHEVKTPGQCLDSYTLTRTWTATDNCGNTSKCTQIITVQDTKAPVLVGCPANITVECNAVPTPAVVTATDNCDANVEVAYHEVKTPGLCLDSYTLTRTWTATDNCGNTSKCTQIITVQDTKAPVLVGCPANITVECDAVPTPAVVTATDNCDANVEVTYHEVKTPGQCLDSYTLTRTWTATDNCGNTSKCTQIITVQDTKAPVLVGCPANITVECDAVPTPAVVTATDNCDANVEVAYHEVKTPGQCLDSYTLTRTWTATDNCGNTSKCTQIITVQDTKAPVLVGCPANITVECDAVPTPAVVTATDNCDANVEVAYHEVKTPGLCLDSYTLTRTWTATDNCGNTSKCTQIITVQDTKAPVLVGCPANITVECDAVPTPAVVTATDNCDANVEVAYHEVKTPGLCLDSYTLTRTWTATDNCGNTSKCTQIITVQDTKAPVLVGCPANITVECDAVPTPAVVTATDNCDANVEVAYHEVKTPGQCLDSYTLTRTWTATDNCGNTSKCTQIITVQDTKAPVLVGCPANITVECDAVPTPAVVTATDNCDANVEVAYHEVKTPGLCLDSYTLTRTWTATDNCGNTSKCTQIITVQDTKAPVLVGCPANITVECNAVTTPAVVTATDNCDANVEVTYHEVKTPGQCLDAYTLTRTWTATDNCGNTSKCTQIITVQDTKAPVLVGCPANITVECDAVPTPAVVTATDNCDANVEVAYHEVKTPGQCLDSYTLTRTWTATDNCGNTSKCTQIITVQDTKAPVLVGCPANITVECNAVPTPAVVTATDNCDANVEVAYHEVKTPGLCLDSYTLTRTWTATDNCGNTSKCTQIITVQDTKAPVLAGCPANITVECDAVPTPAVVTATDNCDANVEVTYHEVKTPGQCLDSYTLTRTWTATDNCGNTSKCTQIITVQDTKAPVLAGCPANITVECDAVPTPAVVTATDNCDANVEVTYHEVKTPGQCLDAYTLTRTWTATDNCGNTSKCTQIITVQDTKAPVLAGCPANITVECDAVPTPAVVTATDNCDANVDVTYHEVKTPGQCLDAYTLTRTWTATDNCGNTSKCTQIITVQDTKAPVLAGCPANITVECDAVPTPAVVTATDNCDTNVEVTYHEVKTPGLCLDAYTLTRTWTATDNCGNTSKCTQIITVQDTKAPVFTSVPANITVECDENLTIENALASDNCDNNITVTYSDSQVTGDCASGKSFIRTFIATDNCGNSATATQKLTVKDTKAPVFANIPANVTIECDQPLPSDLPTASDNCDHNVTVNVTVTESPGKCKHEKTVTRIFTASDDCGNISTSSQVITVKDTKAPVITDCPSDITVTCADLPSETPLTAVDNCDDRVEIKYNEVKVQGNCADSYTLIRTWTATDACGNSSQCTQKVTVIDIKAPVIVQCPANITVECDAVPTPAVITATDDCDANVEITFNEVKTLGTCADSYTLTRIWTATDNCGNTAQCIQKITVRDTKAPVFVKCPSDLTVECNALPEPFEVSVNDNCDPNVAVSYNEVITAGTCAGNYIITKTWTATDNCGNSSQCIQKITVKDIKAPVFALCPTNITVECDAVPAPATVTATDNCDSNVSVSFAENKAAGSCADSYTLTRTWTATDDCGNTAQCVQIITVHDTKAPVFSSVPAHLTIECDGIAPVVLATATDNCDNNVSVTYADSQVSGDCASGKSFVRTFTATDNCGNAATATQIITIKDSEAPVFALCPTNITVECDAVPAPATVTATDNCDSNVSVSFAENKAAGSCADSYTLTRTWTATDDCGNTAQCVQIITVHDTKAPVFTSVPAHLTIECDGIAPVVLATATDNCDNNVSVTYADSQVSGDCASGKSFVRTFTATDNCGNAATATQIITIKDSEAPVFALCPTNITVECDAVPAPATVTATDNCDSNVSVSFAENKAAGSCADSYTLTRTWTATDDCGNTAQCVQIITVHDTKAPVFTSVPAHLTIECDGIAPVVLATATDNCDNNVSVTYADSQVSGDCASGKSFVRTFTATDNCGNAATATQIITIKDSEAPVFALCPTNITVECDAVPAPATVTATDNCDSNVSVSFAENKAAGSCADSYTLTRTWTATDDCGNTAQCVQIITVHDTKAPVFTSVPAHLTIECDGIAPVVLATATDNCDNNVSVTYADSQVSGDCASGKSFVRTFTATDNCGNAATATQIITIKDSEAPVFALCPTNITVECDAVPAPATVTATDNCDSNVSVSFAENKAAGSCADSYTLTRTWTATDDCGNTAQCVQIITVHDTKAPVFTSVPAHLTIECDGIAPVVLATATDNCDNNVSVTYADSQVSGDCASGKSFVRTFTATDNCGNAATATQIITIKDSEAPVFALCPTNITVECDAVPAPATVTATDNCDSNVSVSFAENKAAGSCADSYTLTRTWTATDDCGNTAQCVQIITVHDTKAPVFTSVPAHLTIECDGIAPVVLATATDNCDNNVSVTYADSQVSGDCASGKSFVRTFTATDNCGNAATATQIITIKDSEAPVFALCPTNITVECDAVPAPATVTATDNCDSNVSVSFAENKAAGSCADSYTLTRTWTATDDCGNTAQCVQIITVHDTKAPVFTSVPAHLTIECDGIAPVVLATATDNCDNNVSVTYADSQVSGDCASGKSFVRTFTATDNCGNAATATQIITIKDSEAPVFALCPTNITVECDAVPAPATVTATDNCDSNVSVSFAENKAAGSCADSYTLTRTWTATDDCGNTAQCVQIITVHDTKAPVFSSVPAHLTIECDGIAPVVLATATDNCDNNVSVTYADSQVSGDCASGKSFVRTFTATDNCGNAATATQIITIKDSEAPVFALCPTNITVECDAVPAPATVTATDNCDSNVSVSFAENKAAGSCADSYTLTRTWTATDDCGNTAQCVQIITVHDTKAPVFTSVPAHLTIECDGIAPVVLATATDNCDNNVSVTYADSQVSGDCASGKSFVRTFTATDNCGNAATATQIITVIDNTPPVFTQVPPSVTIECDEAVPGFGSSVIVTDNCDQNVDLSHTDLTTPGNCPQSYTLTRTWLATDDCGNTATAVQTIEVQDTKAPVIIINKPGITNGDTLVLNCDDFIPTISKANIIAKDNCSPKVSIEFVKCIYQGDCTTDGYFELYTYYIKATDACGNSSIFEFAVKVTDNTAPVITGVPADVTVGCGAQVPDLPVVNATDDCSQVVSLTYHETTTAGGNCAGSYVIVRTWTATDECGNVAQASQKITVTDNQPPVFTQVPADQTISCEEQIPAAGNVTVSDDCNPNITVDFNENVVSGACPQAYTIIRTWTATDECGNVAQASQKVTVTDLKAPKFTKIPNSVTIECDETLPGLSGDVVATDNCDQHVDLTYTDTTVPGNCPQAYTLIRTWVATDDCGNTATASQTIYVKDTKAPNIAFNPANPLFANFSEGDTVKVKCDSFNGFGPDDFILSDNCDQNPVFDMVDIFIINEPCHKLLKCIASATDACGNIKELVFYVEVSDNKGPVFNNCPADAVVECDATIPSPSIVTATDDCTTDPEISFAETVEAGNCAHEKTIIRTWIAKDACGNTTVCTQKIEVKDTKAPEIAINLPGFTNGDTITIGCGDYIPGFTKQNVTVTDNCSTDIDVQFCECTYQSDCETAGFYELITYYVKATDECGNQSIFEFSVKVTDNVPPLISGVPADITVACENDIPALPNVTVHDECSDQVSLTYGDTAHGAGNCTGSYIIRTWTAVDDCGNVAQVSQTITIHDNVAPVISGVPADVTVDLDKGQIIPGLPNVNATDNCDNNIQLVFSETTDTVLCNVTITRIWTATDKCGNSVQAIQKITALKNCNGCILPIITQVKVTDASCGQNNGKVEILVSNGADNYEYLWFPNAGITSGAGNIKTNLPAGKYSVIVYYPGYNDCTKKVFFTIEDNKADLISEDNLLVANADCDKPVDVCLGISPVDAVDYDIYDNGVKYAGNLTGCDFDTVMSYTYATIPGQGKTGPYVLESWKVNNNTFNGTFADMNALVNLMNNLDPQANWTLNTKTLSISGGKKGTNYGQMKIVQGNGSGKATLDINTQLVPLGSGLKLTSGNHQIVFVSQTGCSDTVNIKVFCLDPDDIHTTVQVSETKKVCIDNSQLQGTPVSITNICSDMGGEYSIIYASANDYCVSIAGIEPGQEKACIVVCDDLGYCDTTYIYITVVESNFKPNAVDDYRSTLEGKPIIISVLDNDTYGSGTVKVNLISKPDNATVSMYGTKLLTVTPQKGNCEPLEFQYAITNEFGSDTATVFVNINCNDLVFNNGITPNHDGLNDVFFIEGIDKYPDNKLTVFNRWGNQVYSADKYKNDWDGSWNSKMLPDGTYFYIFEDGIGNTYSGYIQILR